MTIMPTKEGGRNQKKERGKKSPSLPYAGKRRREGTGGREKKGKKEKRKNAGEREVTGEKEVREGREGEKFLFQFLFLKFLKTSIKSRK